VENNSFLTWLIGKGASAQVVDDSGSGPLTLCASKGSLSSLKTLLAHGAEPDNNTLHWVISRRRKDDPDRFAMLTLLVEHGADINILETEQPFFTNGRPAKIIRASPLHVAVDQCDLQIIEFLIDHGADVHMQQLARSPYEREFSKSTSPLDQMRVYPQIFGDFVRERFGEETPEEAERRKQRSLVKSVARPVRRSAK
jgi:hypothetical protein